MDSVLKRRDAGAIATSWILCQDIFRLYEVQSGSACAALVASKYFAKNKHLCTS